MLDLVEHLARRAASRQGMAGKVNELVGSPASRLGSTLDQHATNVSSVLGRVLNSIVAPRGLLG